MSFILDRDLNVTNNYNTTGVTYSVNVVDYVINLTKSTGVTASLTLPDATLVANKELSFKNSGSVGWNLLPSGSQTIDGGASTTVAASTGKVRVFSNGSNWLIIA